MLSILRTALCVAPLTFAATLSRPETSSRPGFVTVPLIRLQSAASLDKRQVGTQLYNLDQGTEYLAIVSFGTPPQSVYLLLDTGSSETWVDPNCANASTPTQVQECNSYPRYVPGSSSTAVDLGYTFSLFYGSGSASGEYFRDTFHVGGASLTHQQFGVANVTSLMSTGILAVGFGIEIVRYNCLVDQMHLQGVINSRAFSLDLGSVDSPSGSILFGGIDTMKYTGALEKRPIIPYYQAPDGYIRYWIYMTSVGITKPGSCTSKLYTVPPPAYQQAVILDSGSTLSTLPANLVNAMLADFTGVVAQGGGLYTVDCNQANLHGTLDFGFGDTILHVPYHQFLWVPFPGICVFGAVSADPATYRTWILGDTVLRSAYVVFDQDNKNILLANYINCGTNIVAIGNGTNAVPSITGACTPTITSPCSSSTSSTSISSSAPSTTSSKISTTTPMSSVSLTTTSSNSTNRPTTSTSTNRSSSSSSITSSSSLVQRTPSKGSMTTHASTSSTTSIPRTTSTSTSKTKISYSPSMAVNSTSSITTSKLSYATATPTTVTPTAANKIFGYSYVGCFLDSSPSSFFKILANNSMSVELCLQVAHGAAAPYRYAGLENGRECWAAMTSPAAATPTSGPSACTMTCVGNPAEKCGGSSMFNLYYSAPPATTSQ